MAHEIHNEQFLSKRIPAWHHLGKVFDGELTATEASRMLEIPDVEIEAVSGQKTGPLTNYKAIVGVEPNGTRRVYDVVTRQYHEITHKDFISVWDEATCGEAPVETMGLLYEGSSLFLTTELPSFDVKGDEVKAYLLAYNPLRSGESVLVRKTPVRVVCANTLSASGRMYSVEHRILHTRQARERLKTFIREVYERSVGEYRAVKEVMEILASHRVSDKDMRYELEQIYAAPGMPVNPDGSPLDPHDDEQLRRLESWESDVRNQEAHRQNVFGLYAGDALGADSPAFAGTAWGAYNAVAEYEQYHKKARRFSSVVFGSGQDRIAKAYQIFAKRSGVPVG